MPNSCFLHVVLFTVNTMSGFPSPTLSYAYVMPSSCSVAYLGSRKGGGQVGQAESPISVPCGRVVAQQVTY